ncbi:MAG: Xenobiotic-transporting ATPase [Candidatus Uhrbacteria bacterium GW2011_GWA2_52_8d]|uniref:Xenobiotic-transporting ATPase n=1 Tax=Candidatus Uhrbacteria bacterium GW2011_GWA2_52_8d TaxID=1618979 RepID=A0A0G1XPA9_9BACT|nr:MAG: Xenobiotic-transporting ATPase [Candidatus Uhrbacteria bacterium GW2011_GWA2_52_8d]
MEEQEYSQDNQTSLLGYLKSMGETRDILRWCLCEFVNDTARTFIRRLLIWSVLSRAVSLAYPYLMGLGIDGLYQHNLTFAIFAVVGIALTYVLGSVFEWRAGHFIELTLGENLRTIDHAINKLFFAKNLGLHLQEGGKLTQENMEKGWNRFDMVQKAVLFSGIDSGVTLVLSLLMLSVLSPMCGLIIAATLVGNFVISLSLNRLVTVHMEPVESMFRALTRKRGERWQGVERVITSGRDLEEIEQMNREFTTALEADRKIWLSYIRGTMPRSLLAGFSVTITGLYAGSQVWYGHMDVVDIVPILTWAGMASQQMRFLARVEREVNWCTPSLKSLCHALSLPNQLAQTDQPIVLSDGPVEIAFEGLGHSYDHKRGAENGSAVSVLQELSFRVRPGEKVALIGPSGAGKSTITRLIQRYMDPEHGAIRVNGHDLREVDLRSWRRLVGYIPQTPRVFDGTLRDNLVYSLPPETRSTITESPGRPQWHEALRRRGSARYDRGGGPQASALHDHRRGDLQSGCRESDRRAGGDRSAPCRRGS